MSFKDFDAIARERNKKTIEFQIRGEMYEVPAAIPFFAKIRLAQILSGKAKSDEVSMEELVSLLEAIIGVENTKRLEKSGVSDEEVLEIIQYVSSGQVEEIKTASDTSKTSPKARRGKTQTT